MIPAISFTNDLRRFGPDTSLAPTTRSAARFYCRRLAQTHYENFSVASLLLPRPLMQHFYNVYAYCRWADDLADETGGGQNALELLRWWRDELLRCYDGRPWHPVMIALRETIDEFTIPQRHFLDLLYAFEQDQIVKEYQSLNQLLNYCRYSANPVGRLVLHLFHAHDDANGMYSDKICTALQLTNFWQDVSRDLSMGRVYLPAEERRRFGYTDDDLHARRYNHPFADLMAYLVERTRELFRQGRPLIRRLPMNYRSDVELFIRGGEAILDKISRKRGDVWTKRPKLSKWDKGALTMATAWRRLTRSVVASS